MKLFKKLIATAIIASMAGAVYADKKHNKTAFQKVKGELSVMVLGSGGPIATAEGRASAGYLIFTDGKPRVLMDVGGGTYQRLAQSGTNIKDLDIVLLSHLHADHTGDLTSVMKTVYFHNNLARSQAAAQGVTLPGRTAPINIYGPTSSALPAISAAKGTQLPAGVKYPNGKLVYPSTENYTHDHFSIARGGVEHYLTAFVNGISDDNGPNPPIPFGQAGGPVSKFAYTANDLSSKVPRAQIEEVYNNDGLVITAIAVDHGPVPAVAFRIDYKGHSVVYSGDTGTKGRGANPFAPGNPGQGNMALLSQNADILIYDTAIMEFTGNPATQQPGNPLFHILHTQPSRIAGVAKAANVKTLVLSHLTPVTSGRTDEIKDIIEGVGFTGKIKVAKDLKVYNLGDDHDDDD